jgi:hypothetical protein
MSDGENNDDTFIAFVQLKGHRAYLHQTGWVQMQVSGKESFGDLLQGSLVELQQMEVIDDSQIFNICRLPCRVCHYYPAKETRVTERVACSLESRCAALRMLGNHHVQYPFGSAGIIPEKLLATPKNNSLAMLMHAQQQRFFPVKYKSEEGKPLSFSLKLFNFVMIV